MEIYFLIGTFYAFLSKNPSTNIIGFILTILIWPLDILKHLQISWNKTKNENQVEKYANIKLCHDSMEEFHNTLADTIFEETSKGLADHPEDLQTAIIIYEIQAALAAAEDFQIDEQYHTDFATSVLTRGGIPLGHAAGMVTAVDKASSEIYERTKHVINGQEGYNQFISGTDHLIQHVRDTLKRLKKHPDNTYKELAYHNTK